MVIMDQPILSILLFAAVIALLVFAFGFLMQAVGGGRRETMSITDLLLLILFIALAIYALKALNLWPTLIVGI